MKTKINIRPLRNMACFILMQAVISSSCSKSGTVALTPQQQLTAALMANTWKMHRVSVDDVDVTSQYAGMTIHFTTTSYTTTNGHVVWPPSGTWTFVDATTIKRDDGIEVAVTATATTLQLGLMWPTTTLGGGRSGSIKGHAVFEFTN